MRGLAVQTSSYRVVAQPSTECCSCATAEGLCYGGMCCTERKESRPGADSWKQGRAGADSRKKGRAGTHAKKEGRS